MKIRMPILVAALAGALAALGADAPAPTAAAAPAANAAATATKSAATSTKSAAAPRTFATPEEAAAALAEAVRKKSVADLLAVVGPSSKSWLFSGDKVADANDWEKFLAAYGKKNSLERQGDAKAILQVGDGDWPFPAPIVKHGARWAFDADAGREELINRRVGRNELDTIETLLAVVDAQREYAAKDSDGNGYADYARRFLSTPGKKDGLYWKTEPGQPESPLGPLVAVAASEGYGYGKAQKDKTARQPYHGYHFRLLTSQGKDAPGGAYDYMVGDKLLGGFGVVAWPATYGVSGVMTFVVNHEGVVFEKDLGPKSASIASVMTVYNPDSTWRKAQQ